MRLWAAFVSMTEGHFIQVSSLTVGSVVWKGQKGERPLRVAVRQELLVFVTCWRGNEKEFVAARCTNASSVPFIIPLLNLPSEANPQTPDSEVYVLQAAVSVSLSIVSSLLHFSWFTLFQASEAARSQVTDTWWRRDEDPRTGRNVRRSSSREARVDLTSSLVTVFSADYIQSSGRLPTLNVAVSQFRSASFRGAFEGQLCHNTAWSLSQSEGSSRGSVFSLFLEDALLRSFMASHIPRFSAHPKKKKERQKMATSRGVDRHFRGPGRQKSWRKSKTSGDATRKCSKG